jgi:hypothetical protein
MVLPGRKFVRLVYLRRPLQDVKMVLALVDKLKQPKPMTLTTIILLVLALYGVQIFLQETARFRFDLWEIMGNRDKPPEMSIVAGRLDRARITCWRLFRFSSPLRLWR